VRGVIGSLSRLWIPIAVLLALWAAWALFARDPGPRAEAAQGAESVGAAPGSVAAEGGAPSLAQGGGASSRAAREFGAPAATYSILVGSYIRLGDAMQRRDELASDGGLFFVTPTPVQGRVYQRVLAGVFEDRTQATSAMERLVADGRKELIKEWDVRPVRLAYDLGTFATRDSARNEAERYTAGGIPAYVLRDTARTPLYRVYAGAFEREASAEALRVALEARGSAAQLNLRTGVAP
jgi:cell division septation protein DedD